ncbi:MAG: class I SAM-dependent methyltransferase [Myxococcales bacterium]|nr:class I SAM-dependent methyltransferase [Myxococcales bacterium]
MFEHIERMQAGAPWGRLLDAGTGTRSLDWIRGLSTIGWTAVTASPEHAEQLRASVCLRPEDAVIAGNWSDPALLRDETFDTVVAEHVLGAIDTHAPYFRARFLERLRDHVAGRLYLTGIAPHGLASAPEARLVDEVFDVRDVIFLLCRWRPYREVPLDWVTHALGQSGYRVEQAIQTPRRAEGSWVSHQIDGCLQGLAHLDDDALAEALRARLERLRTQVLTHIERHGPIPWTHDWCVWAQPEHRQVQEVR